jgi:hypothetical protein
MQKNLSYKTKLNFENTSDKARTMKLELIISSNHNLEDNLLNGITNSFKKLQVMDYKESEEKPKVKK